MDQEKKPKQRVANQKDLFIIRAINTAINKILENPYVGSGVLSSDPENKTISFDHVGYKDENIDIVLNGTFQNTVQGDLSISVTDFKKGTIVNGEEHTYIYNNITDTKKEIKVLSEHYIDGSLLIRE